MGFRSVVSKDRAVFVLKNTMSAFQRYSSAINDDLLRSIALRAFSAVINDREGRMTYRVLTDEQMCDVLDDGDHAFWLKKKAEHFASSNGWR